MVNISKSCLITGITGQDGSFLAEQLLSKGYEVYGLVYRDFIGTVNIDHIKDSLFLRKGNLRDFKSIERVVKEANPDEIYNFGSMSFVGRSFTEPTLTADVTGLGVTRVLEAMRRHASEARFYQASSSEMFGRVQESPQRETTPFYPQSPYGVAKVYGFWMTANYRESYGMFASNGIWFNNESERRGAEFVTRKISKGVAEISLGLRDTIGLGDISARRDWGYAPEYTDFAWRVLQHYEPDDFIAATGETHSVKEFLEEAFHIVGIANWTDYVVLKKQHLRPSEVPVLCGDATKAKKILGWTPKVRFKELVKLMVDADVKAVGEGGA